MSGQLLEQWRQEFRQQEAQELKELLDITPDGLRELHEALVRETWTAINRIAERNRNKPNISGTFLALLERQGKPVRVRTNGSNPTWVRLTFSDGSRTFLHLDEVSLLKREDIGGLESSPEGNKAFWSWARLSDFFEKLQWLPEIGIDIGHLHPLTEAWREIVGE